MELQRVERALDAGQHWSIFSYEDAQCEFPERLVAEWLREAIAAGAVVRNHSEVLAVDIAHGRARGILLRDRTNGRDERITAAWVLNCTGPWADRIFGKVYESTHEHPGDRSLRIADARGGTPAR